MPDQVSQGDLSVVGFGPTFQRQRLALIERRAAAAGLIDERSRRILGLPPVPSVGAEAAQSTERGQQ